MMEMLIVLAVSGLVVFVSSSIMIVSDLHSRGHKINWFLLRLYLPKYVHEYKKVTESETGRVGTLFKIWLISVNTALVAVIGALLMKIL